MNFPYRSLRSPFSDSMGTISGQSSTLMPLTEESRPLTGFCTPWKVYQWTVLPMGVKVRPQVCQRMVTHCIRHLPPSARAYVDYVLVGTPPSKASRVKHQLLDRFASMKRP